MIRGLHTHCRPDEPQHGRLEDPCEQEVGDDGRDVDHPEERNDATQRDEDPVGER